MTEKMREQAKRLFLRMFNTLPMFDEKEQVMRVYTKSINKKQMKSLGALLSGTINVSVTSKGMLIEVHDYKI